MDVVCIVSEAALREGNKVILLVTAIFNMRFIFEHCSRWQITLQSSIYPHNSQISGHFIIPLNPKV